MREIEAELVNHSDGTNQQLWKRLEVLVTAIATLLLVVVHFTLLQHAGPLWRDEVNSIQVATTSTWSKMWSLLWTDGFPILPFAVFRGWAALGLAGTDEQIRLLGFLIGLSILGVLWCNARVLGYTCPTIALILFAFSAVTIRFGDSLRGYGLGVALLLLCFPLMWKLTAHLSRRSFLAALIGCLLATQSMYQSSFLLACLGLAGVIVAVCDRNWKSMRAIIGVGAICAASLLFYIPVLITGSKAFDFHGGGLNIQVLWQDVAPALSSPHPLMFWAWMLCTGLGLGAGVLLAVKAQSRIHLFAVVVLLSTPLSYFLFLKSSGLSTNIWYYLPVLALMAMALDVIFGLGFPSRSASVLRATVMAAACALLFYPSWQKAHARQTNADLVAQLLHRRARAGDFIIVNPWFFGQSFERYYRGRATWMTLPPLGQTKRRPDPNAPLAPLLAGIEQSLRSGHRVWFVGKPALVENLPSLLSPAKTQKMNTTSFADWSCNNGRCDFKTLRQNSARAEEWSLQTGYFLYLHSTSAQLLPSLTLRPVNPFEVFEVAVLSGWHDAPTPLP